MDETLLRTDRAIQKSGQEEQEVKNRKFFVVIYEWSPVCLCDFLAVGTPINYVKRIEGLEKFDKTLHSDEKTIQMFDKGEQGQKLLNFFDIIYGCPLFGLDQKDLSYFRILQYPQSSYLMNIHAILLFLKSLKNHIIFKKEQKWP